MNDDQAPVQFMSHHTAVEYKIPEPSLVEHPLRRGARAGLASSATGARSARRSTCRRAATARCASSRPPRPTRSRSPTDGTITTFSVITPLQYQGQEETEDYVQGTILLDGADTTIMVMRMDGIAIADMRMGMRVQAVWPPEAKRPDCRGSSVNRGMGLGDAVERWEPTGEPDLTREQIAEHIL